MNSGLTLSKSFGIDTMICVIVKDQCRLNKEQTDGTIGQAELGSRRKRNRDSDSEPSTEIQDEIMCDTNGAANEEDGNIATHDASQVEILIPRAVLCQSSQFFQTATKNEWAVLRDREKTITVVFKTELFQAYVHWLYFGTIPRLCLADGSSTTPPRDYLYLAQLYVLGEEIMDSRFKNAILDNFAAVYLRIRKSPSADVVAIIYGATAEKSPMRRMLAQQYAHCACDPWTLKDLPKEALLDILEFMVKVRPSIVDEKPWLEVDKYHEKEEV